MPMKNESFDSAVSVLSPELEQVLMKIPESRKRDIQEIRLRSNKPLVLSSGTQTLFVCGDGTIVYSPQRAYVCSGRDIFDTFRRMCSYSVYSRQSDIREGFITVSGGHRVGLCGTADVRDGRIHSVTDITSLNIRIARRIDSAAEKLMPCIMPLDGGVLIAGAPASGKTTLLRDIARRLSLGVNCPVTRTCVIDERGELSCGTELGLCDVMRFYPKGEGILHAVRSLSPQVIICDEVGTPEDAEALTRGANAGAYIIATIHAGGKGQLFRRVQTAKLRETGAFTKLVMLDTPDRPGRFTDITDLSDRRWAV